MERDFTQPPAGEITTLGRKAWTAYAAVIVASLLLFVFIVPILWAMTSYVVGMVALLLSLLWVAYKLIELRAYHLYCNEAGVWLSSGVLPWNKGVRGVKWRDVDDATFSQSFWTWLLKSHRVRVGHRFTRSNELVVSSIGHGDKAVMTINTKLQELARSNRLS
jgi:hypothetical protein